MTDAMGRQALWEDRQRSDVLEAMSDEERFLRDICPYCGSERHRTQLQARDQLFDRGTRRFRLLQCEECGGRFTCGSDFVDLADFYAISYPREYHEGAAGGQGDDPGSNPGVREVLLEHLPSPLGVRVLDVGAGNGGFLAYLRAAGFEVEGLEPSLSGSAYCRDVHGIPCFTGTVEQFRPTKALHAATLVGVIEHLINPLRTLRALHSLLANDATLVFDYPNIVSFEARIAGGHWWALDLPRHTLHFTPDLAVAVARASGFRVERRIRLAKSWFHMGFLRPPTWDGIPRRSPAAVPIYAAALALRGLRLCPHEILVCRRVERP